MLKCYICKENYLQVLEVSTKHDDYDIVIYNIILKVSYIVVRNKFFATMIKIILWPTEIYQDVKLVCFTNGIENDIISK